MKTFLFLSALVSLAQATENPENKWIPHYQKSNNLQEKSQQDLRQEETRSSIYAPKLPPPVNAQDKVSLPELKISKVPPNGPPPQGARPQEVEKNLKKTSAPPATALATISLDKLETLYRQEYKKKEDMKELRAQTLAHSGKAVPLLIKVMKEKDFPDKNKWVATFLLAKIMGNKSSAYLSKFLHHPNWVLRLAVLKTLLHFKEKKYGDLYSQKLSDQSYIVRMQALENIRHLQLGEYSAQVWGMLFNENNYMGKKGQLKRGHLIRNVIRALGDLKYDRAKDHLLKLVQKKEYQDVFEDLDYSLSQIVGKESPKGDARVKKFYWERVALSDQQI